MCRIGSIADAMAPFQFSYKRGHNLSTPNVFHRRIIKYFIYKPKSRSDSHATLPSFGSKGTRTIMSLLFRMN